MCHLAPLKHGALRAVAAIKNANSFCNQINSGGTFWWTNISWTAASADKEQSCPQGKQQAGAGSSHGEPSCTHPVIVSAAANTGTHYGGASLLCHCLPEAMAENEPHIGARDK